MSVRYDRLVPSLKTLLPEDTLSWLGRAVAFIRRLREIEASLFVWSVVLSRFGSGRPAFEQARQWYERLGGASIWRRPFQMRFKKPATVRLFEQAFQTAVTTWRDPSQRRARHPLQRCFPDVVVWDSTVMQVADSLKKVFKGTRSAKASLKACVAITVFGLLPLFAEIVAGNRHDMMLFPPLHLFQRGTLLLFDKGFACYARLRTIADAGHHYLCPMRLNGNALIVKARSAPGHVRKALRRRAEGILLRDVLSAKKRIGRVWDLDVLVRPQANATDKTWIQTRLVIVPGPEGKQHPYLTNLAAPLWKPRALRELYRLRWQIELVFKELKQSLNLETLPSSDRHAVQVLAWASLLALALSRCVATWIQPLALMTGLASRARPHLVTRALRATVRLLGRALAASGRHALMYLRLLADELLREARSFETAREDSFRRLLPLLPRSPA
jgi:Transposase DDE domain